MKSIFPILDQLPTLLLSIHERKNVLNLLNGNPLEIHRIIVLGYVLIRENMLTFCIDLNNVEKLALTIPPVTLVVHDIDNQDYPKFKEHFLLKYSLNNFHAWVVSSVGRRRTTRKNGLKN